jgi:NO-binding membrane sensor protein with MHYT domain
MNSSPALLVGSYDPWLVIVSVMIAILAGGGALDLAGRVTFARGAARVSWLAGGATAMGIGIWSMHYIGMLAFKLPVPASEQRFRLIVETALDAFLEIDTA